MTNKVLLQPQLEDGLDRTTLTALKKRFYHINDKRLSLTLSALTERQRVFPQILPLLIHVNHPLLPGYLSKETPCGLANFTPSKEQLKVAQSIAKSFRYKKENRQSIKAIFLMGSTGTIAQSGKSDLDIWVCHDSVLSTEEVEGLQRKVNLIQKWGKELGLESHFFLMNPERFKAGENTKSISEQNSGSTQHDLLLDEFYRTSVLLAGLYPIWWLVPAYEEHRYEEYAGTLCSKRFIRADESIDFGGLGHFRIQEFVSAGLWQLYKGLLSPYKSLLKLLLIELYSSEYPKVTSLALDFKQAIYEGEQDINTLDPYVMLYQKLEKYLLENNEPKRLELIRRCFYFKVGIALSDPTKTSTSKSRIQAIARLSKQWGWDSAELLQLDSRKKWKVQRVLAEMKELVDELKYIYRQLSQFARQNNASSLAGSKDIDLLGRKFYAAFERKAGKIDIINPSIALDLAETHLSFYQTNIRTHIGVEAVWKLYTGNVLPEERKKHTEIKRKRSMVELLVWSHINGLLDDNTQVVFHPGNSSLSYVELMKIIKSIQQHLPLPLPVSKLQDFSSAAYPLHILFFTNIEGNTVIENILEPASTPALTRALKKGMHATDEEDINRSLDVSMDQINCNSWREISVERYDDQHAVVNCLQLYLQSIIQNADNPLPKLDFRCFTTDRVYTITHRIEELFTNVAATFIGNSNDSSIDKKGLKRKGITRIVNANRYVVTINNWYYIFQVLNHRVSIRKYEQYQQLLHGLAERQQRYSTITLDPHTLANTPLAVACKNLQAYAKLAESAVQIFYYQNTHSNTLFIFDEKGSLLVTQSYDTQASSQIRQLYRFLNAILYRQYTNEDIDPETSLTPFIRCQEIIFNAQEKIYLLNPQQASETKIGHKYFEVQALGELTKSGDMRFTIYCDHEEFCAFEYGEDLFAEVATYILSQRKTSKFYPCYITDLDLSSCRSENGQPLQTIQFLQYKYTLEQALNKALKESP